MTLIRDLIVGHIYRHEPGAGFPGRPARWIILRKDPCLGGFEIEYTTMESTGPFPTTNTEQYSPDHSWPVVSDEYLISEEPW